MMQDYEDLGLGAYRAWLFERRVVVHGVDGYSREGTDNFIASMLATGRAWDVNQPYYALIDLSKAAVTRYAEQQMQAFFKVFPHELKGMVVSVLPNTIVGQMMRFFAQRFATRQLVNIDNFFVNRFEDGVALFEKKLHLGEKS